MNGTVPPKPSSLENIPEPSQKVQVMNEKEVLAKRDPVQRLPRQAAHYAQIVSHFLEVKESKQIARAMAAHFQRLAKYHQTLLGIAATAVADEDQTEGDSPKRHYAFGEIPRYEAGNGCAPVCAS